jgi:hypothetical protein
MFAFPVVRSLVGGFGPAVLAALLTAPAALPSQKNTTLPQPTAEGKKLPVDNQQQTELEKARAEIKKLNADVARLQADAKKWQEEAKKLRAQLEQKRKKKDQDKEREIAEATDAAVDRDPQARRLQDQLDELQREVDEYTNKGFGSNYVALRIARERADAVRRQLRTRRNTLAERVKRAYKNRAEETRDESLHRKVDRLLREVDDLRREMRQK